MCSSYADAVPTGRSRPQVAIQHPIDRPPEVDGIPISVETLDALRGEATFDDEFVADGAVVSSVRSGLAPTTQDPAHPRTTRPALPDPRLRTTRRLQNHHLVPSSWGGTDEPDNLARVCPHHHGLLIPNGPYALIGDPSRPDGSGSSPEKKPTSWAPAGPDRDLIRGSSRR